MLWFLIEKSKQQKKEQKEEAIVSHEIEEKLQKNKTKRRKQNALSKVADDRQVPLPLYLSRTLDIRGTFHSTGYSGLRFRALHVTNGAVFSG